ncbi:MAG: NAD-dependent epimerase/dehydratase family protein [Candidatus Accumulibacter sp.]|uniref:NAD-dependent epimerase/dehydratase family protein n=1 Tax=Accumulibacter sp. TaxID=2053492 RepID=UPI001AD3E5DE|nr:NAD-dependent epimerase/dehydratase family protein [Accumulibacter sp.]MBN8436988.1 NAD-dependent epimerase/dehydratase family protein [Accumulibacter sp.]
MSGQVLVTGATGFVGSAVIKRLAMKNMPVRGVTRRYDSIFRANVEMSYVDELSDCTDWTASLTHVSGVVHCAARVHILRDTAPNPLLEFRRINALGTIELARQAASLGVRRFVFISSIGVNGAETFGQPFTAGDKVSPHSPYALSKHEAELGLKRIAEETGLEVVIIRPPMVYGPGAPGNFDRMMHLLNGSALLPLGAVKNQRSFVALDNLIDLVLTCLHHPAAANQTFLVSDGEDLSTTDLLRRTARALGTTAKLLPVPPTLLRALAVAAGKGELAQRLFGSLQVDSGKARSLLGWSPQVTVDEGLQLAANYFLAQRDQSLTAYPVREAGTP